MNNSDVYDPVKYLQSEKLQNSRKVKIFKRLFSLLHKYKVQIFGSAVTEFVRCGSPEMFIIKGIDNVGDLDILFTSNNKRKNFIRELKAAFHLNRRTVSRSSHRSYANADLHIVDVICFLDPKNYAYFVKLGLVVNRGGDMGAGDCDINSLICEAHPRSIMHNIRSRDHSCSMEEIIYNIRHNRFVLFEGSNLLKRSEHVCVTHPSRHYRYRKMLNKGYRCIRDGPNRTYCENQQCLFHIRYSDYKQACAMPFEIGMPQQQQPQAREPVIQHIATHARDLIFYVCTLFTLFKIILFFMQI